MKYKMYYLAILLGIASCIPSKLASQELGKQWNITVLLDVSDRIEPSLHPAQPSHRERDLALVDAVVEHFRQDMRQRGTFGAKGRLRVLFSPLPESPRVNELAQALSVDLGTMSIPEKKRTYADLPGRFRNSLEAIYKQTLDTKNYIGADVWRFFKNDVMNYCVEDPSAYRNMLILITDGYIFHEDSKYTKGNLSAYITPSFLQATGLRGATDWQKKMEQGGFGLIPVRNDLQDLEVLVLEVNADDKHPEDEDIVKAFLSDWLGAMGVKRQAIFFSGLPGYTRDHLEDFLDGSGLKGVQVSNR